MTLVGIALEKFVFCPRHGFILGHSGAVLGLIFKLISLFHTKVSRTSRETMRLQGCDCSGFRSWKKRKRQEFPDCLCKVMERGGCGTVVHEEGLSLE